MHTYRILGKAMWGIVITIDAVIHGGQKENCPRVGLISLDISNVGYLSEQEKNYLTCGVRWVYDLIKIENETLVKIESIRFNPCDYQAEGLFFAMAEWLSKEYDFEMPEYSYHFDKENNRYIFPMLSE